MKINWGARIAILYGGFVILIAALVTGSMRQDFDLVSKDYYQDELKYQEVINAGKNQSGLSAPVFLSATERTVTVEFPKEMRGNIMGGTIKFYSQVDAAWDREYTVTNISDAMVIPRTDLQHTLYTVKIKWTANEKEYYQESNLNLNK